LLKVALNTINQTKPHVTEITRKMINPKNDLDQILKWKNVSIRIWMLPLAARGKRGITHSSLES
jgi:hypothetical protein